MAELRITLRLDDAAVPADRQESVLDRLAEALERHAALGDRPAPIPDIDDDGNLHPMFLLRVADAEALAGALRALGAWYMQHPDVPVVCKATGRGGRVALQLTRFSTVAFAEAATRLRGAVAGGDQRPSS